jgi:hypothetical protein
MTKERAFEYLEHAGNCAACAEELQFALFATGDNAPVPEEIWQHMKTHREEWQRQFAEQITAKLPAAEDRIACPAKRESEGVGELLSRSLSRMVKALTKKKPPR